MDPVDDSVQYIEHGENIGRKNTESKSRNPRILFNTTEARKPGETPGAKTRNRKETNSQSTSVRPPWLDKESRSMHKIESNKVILSDLLPPGRSCLLRREDMEMGSTHVKEFRWNTEFLVCCLLSRGSSGGSVFDDPPIEPTSSRATSKSGALSTVLASTNGIVVAR